MGICPRCGSWVDEGEPYCPECGYMGGDETVTIRGREYDADDVVMVLRDYGYDLNDLEWGRIGDVDMQRILDDLS